MTLHLVQEDKPRRIEIPIPDDLWERLASLETPGNSLAKIMVTASRYMLSEMDKAVASDLGQAFVDEEGMK